MRSCHGVFLLIAFLGVPVQAQDTADERTSKRSSQPVIVVPRQAQQSLKEPTGAQSKNVDDPALRRFFDEAEDALLSGDADFFASHFATSVVLNLRGAESGSFSSNQAFYVLRNYLRTRKVVHLDLEQSAGQRPNPYASGVAGVSLQGGRENMNVYIEVKKTGSGWAVVLITFS